MRYWWTPLTGRASSGLMLTPIFWIGFIGAAVWILVTSVMLTMRERAGTT